MAINTNQQGYVCVSVFAHVHSHMHALSIFARLCVLYVNMSMDMCIVCECAVKGTGANIFQPLLESHKSGREGAESKAADVSGRNTGLSVLQVHPVEGVCCCQSFVAVGFLP